MSGEKIFLKKQKGGLPSNKKNNIHKEVKDLYKKYKNNLTAKIRKKIKDKLHIQDLDKFINDLKFENIKNHGLTTLNSISDIIKPKISELKQPEQKKINDIIEKIKTILSKTAKNKDKKEAEAEAKEKAEKEKKAEKKKADEKKPKKEDNKNNLNGTIKKYNTYITEEEDELKDKLKNTNFSEHFTVEEKKELPIVDKIKTVESLLGQSISILKRIKSFNNPIFNNKDGNSHLDKIIQLKTSKEELEDQKKEEKKEKQSKKDKKNREKKVKIKQRILSWNVNKWKENNKIGEYVNFIKDINPVIILLQQNDLLKEELKEKFPAYVGILMSDISSHNGTTNVILSKYNFKAQSSLNLPQITVKKNTDYENILFNQCKKKSFISYFFGGSPDIPDDETEFVKKKDYNMLVAQLEFKNGEILNISNVELLETPENIINSSNDSENKLSQSCKDEMKEVYKTARLKQFERFYEFTDTNKLIKHFGFKFRKDPTYIVSGGDFHETKDTKLIKEFITNHRIGIDSLVKNNTEYLGMDHHNDPSVTITHSSPPNNPTNKPVILEFHFPIFNSNYSSIKTAPLEEFEKIILQSNDIDTDSSTISKTNKPAINEQTKKLPGLDNFQNEKYNDLRKKDFNNLSDDDKQTLKTLKDISEKHLENKKVKSKEIQQKIYKGLAEIKESPCPSLDYLQCRKITLDELFEMIETVLKEDKNHKDKTNARLEELKRKVGDKCNDKNASVNIGEKDILENLETKEKDWNKYQELLAKNKSNRDGIDKNNLEKYKTKHLKGKLKLTNEEKDKLIKLRQKDKDGILKLSECSELKLLRHSKRNHLIQDLKVHHLNGELTKDQIKDILNNINKLNEHLGINEKHEMTANVFEPDTNKDNSETKNDNSDENTTKKSINKEEIIKNVEDFLSKDEFKTELIMFRLYKLKNLDNLSDDGKLKFLKKILESTSVKAKMELSRLKSLTISNNSIYEKYEELLNSINEALSQSSLNNISNLITIRNYKDAAIKIKKIIKNKNIKSSIIFSELMNLSNDEDIGKEDLIKSLNLMKPKSYQNSFKNLMKLSSGDNKTVNKNTNDLENITYEELKELLDKLNSSAGGGNYLSKLNNIVKFKGGNIILNPTKKPKINNKRIDILKIIKNLLNINKKLKLK